MNSTYSFSDCSLVLSHPNVGKYTMTGQGVGQVTVARANDMSQQDIAADGSIMTSKIVTKNGSVAIQLQQTSAAHLWILKWLQYLTEAPTREWTQTMGILNCPGTGEMIMLVGVCPQKMADRPFQAAGQQVTWNLLVSQITG